MLIHMILLVYKLSYTVSVSSGTDNVDDRVVRSRSGPPDHAMLEDRVVLEIPDTGEYEDDNKPSIQICVLCSIKAI